MTRKLLWVTNVRDLESLTRSNHVVGTAKIHTTKARPIERRIMKGSVCNHEICNTPVDDTDREVTLEEVAFVLECAAERGLIVRAGRDENGEMLYGLPEVMN